MTFAVADLPDLNDAGDLAECWAAFEPRPHVGMRDWCESNVVTEHGRPYDHAAYPHTAAPGGPMDAFDDPRVRSIALQWGVRLGKTFFGQCALLKTAHVNPAPMMLVSSQEKLARDVTTRTYEMLRKSPALRGLLARHERLQKQDLIEFHGCKLHVGWSRSASTLADKKIVVGLANEVDKWEHRSTATEGDPYDLFQDRFNDDWVVRKILAEGTPAVKGRSRIERLRLRGWNCSYFVPCPACRRYQVIEFGDVGTGWGIKWENSPGGRSDPELARQTAGYICRHCAAKIPSESRQWMMRRGVRAPEGCTIRDEIALEITEGRLPYIWNGWKNAAWAAATPLRDGEDASYHLATLCALSIPEWGDFAKKFLEAKVKTQSLRAFINQWLARTWEVAERQQTWEQLGSRLVIDVPRGLIPAGYSLLTAGIDKQKDSYVWVIDCWNAHRAPHTLAYGTCDSLAEVGAQVMTASFTAADGGSLAVRLALIDSGYRPADVYRFARKYRRRLFPCKGASTPLNTFAVRKVLGAENLRPRPTPGPCRSPFHAGLDSIGNCTSSAPAKRGRRRFSRDRSASIRTSWSSSSTTPSSPASTARTTPSNAGSGSTKTFRTTTATVGGTLSPASCS